MSAPKDVAYGAAPWRQTSWDARAAGNFIGGGTGAGLIVFTVVASASGMVRTGLLLIGLVLVAAGLASVALEMGRPLRAMNVFRHPRRSWMSREAIAALLLAIFTLAACSGYRVDMLAAALALLFVYCQARLLQAAKGIPAWHEPRIVPLLVTMSLVEGAGLFWLLAPLHRSGGTRLLLGFAALLLLRAVLCHTYRQRVNDASPAAGAALGTAVRVLAIGGTLVPIVLIALAVWLPYSAAMQAIALAGVLAWIAGAWLKLAIVTRAGFNRGFTLPALPVRGTRA
ncbi:MAG TPA: DmsC/YnfH family molybdoenzyme membrane anchor subunit [Casimicrobiaceae bacterium]|nr:DmsC/YnfH family molybdoenzyme membrane anchor subunit [Casimicrobiaceae bacterium]